MANVSANVEPCNIVILNKLGVYDQSKVHYHCQYVLVLLNLGRTVCIYMRLRSGVWHSFLGSIAGIALEIKNSQGGTSDMQVRG